MKSDLRGLAHLLGNVLGILGLLTAAVALIIWVTGRDEPGPRTATP